MNTVKHVAITAAVVAVTVFILNKAAPTFFGLSGT